MPTTLRLLGVRFFFYSNEGNEPPHVPIEKGDAESKYWIDPVEIGYMEGFTNGGGHTRRAGNLTTHRKGNRHPFEDFSVRALLQPKAMRATDVGIGN